MKFVLLLLFFFIPFLGFSLSVKQDTFGDIKIFITDSYVKADLIVYITDVSSVAKNKEEVWFWEKNTPDILVKITDIQSAADIKVYFSVFQSQAGWKKDHPLKGELLKTRR